jgi:hypothetical protein
MYQIGKPTFYLTVNLKDDVSIKYGECEDPNFVSVTCDFEEEHICGYQSDSTAKFNWIRSKGSTSSAGSGPSIDV